MCAFRSAPWLRGIARLSAVVALAVATIGCEETPTQPSDTPTTRTLFFSNRMQVGTFAWRTFTIDEQSDVEIQLISVTPETEAVVSLGYGVFTAGDCVPSTSVETASATTPQITTDLAPGTYCVRVADIGNLTRDWTFIITIDITS
jgi:hypothetical protein